MSKQQELEGVPQNAVIPAVREAAEKFEKLRDDWMKLGAPMRKAREELITVMEQNGVEYYVEDDLKVRLMNGAKKVKVKRGEGEPEDD